MIRRKYFREPGLVAVLAILISLVVSFLPSDASATLAEDIEAAILAELWDLAGTEMTMDSMSVEFLGVEIAVTALGFALCEPADPYVTPVPTPLPRISDYGCENFATVDADVDPEETGAIIQIGLSKLYLDLETDRNEIILCTPHDTYPYTGQVLRDGYFLGQVTVVVGFTLDFIDGCFQVGLIPDTASLALTPEEIGTKDGCMDANMNSVVVPILYPMIQEKLDEEFEQILLDNMADINDALCLATPVVNRSWGSLKTAYR